MEAQAGINPFVGLNRDSEEKYLDR